MEPADVRHRPKKAERMRLQHEGVQQVLDGVVSTDGLVAALPLFYQDPRKVKKSLAGSTIKKNINRWLDSEEGQAWMIARNKSLGSISKLNGNLSSDSSDQEKA